MNFPVKYIRAGIGYVAVCLFFLPGCSRTSSETAIPAAVPTVSTPVISPAGGDFTSARNVTMSCETDSVTIRYTTDGSTPTDSYGIVYTGSFTVANTQTIEAVASRSEYNNSKIAKASFTIASTVANPVFSVSGGSYADAVSVALSCPTQGATIRYTINDANPSGLYGIIYEGQPITVDSTLTPVEIKAIAYMSGYTDSSISSASYSITGHVQAPVFAVTQSLTDPAAFTYTIACGTAGAVIRYTTDGKDPTRSNGTLYSAEISASSSVCAKACAYVPSWSSASDSAVTTLSYATEGTVPIPVCMATGTIKEGCYTGSVTIVLSSDMSGATISYSLDGGSTWSPYTEGITLSAPTDALSKSYTLSYKATMSGIESAVTDTTYTVTNAVASPVFSLTDGYYTDAQSLTISCSTDGAVIFYTTDGTDPTSAVNATVYSGSISIDTKKTYTIKAYATRTGCADSTVVIRSYTMTGRVPSVVFTPDSCSKDNPVTVSMSLSDTTFSNSGVIIRYTTDGSTPSRTANGTTYSSPLLVGSKSSTTVKAIAYIPDWQVSSDTDVTEATYTVARTIYCAGNLSSSTGSTTATVWKNGAVILLSAPSGASAVSTYATGIGDDGTNIYVSGSYATSDSVHHACAWKIDSSDTVTSIPFGLISASNSTSESLNVNNDDGGSQTSGIYVTSAGAYASGYFTAYLPSEYAASLVNADSNSYIWKADETSYKYRKFPCIWKISDGSGTMVPGFSVTNPLSGVTNPTSGSDTHAGYSSTQQALCNAMGYSANGNLYYGAAYAAADAALVGNTWQYAFGGSQNFFLGMYTTDIILTSSSSSETAFFAGYTDNGTSRHATCWIYANAGITNATTNVTTWTGTGPTEYILSDGTNAPSTSYYGISKICKLGSTYYCAGYRKLSSGKFRACIWSGDASSLAGGAPSDLSVTSVSDDSFTSGIAGYSPYVYAVGYETVNGTDTPRLWINGVEQTIGVSEGTLSIQGIVIR